MSFTFSTTQDIFLICFAMEKRPNYILCETELGVKGLAQ